jgi:hypothetical protein
MPWQIYVGWQYQKSIIMLISHPHLLLADAFYRDMISDIAIKMIPLNTKRLELIPITVGLCNADLHSLDILCRHLHAFIPDLWPPA